MRQSVMRSTLLVLAVIVTLGIARPAHADVLSVGDRLAELDVATDAAGKAFKLKALKGKWLLITVGADWCDACKKELPTWDKPRAGLRGQGARSSR